MRSRPLRAFIACLALPAAGLGGCAAFDLGPQTEAAELANAQTQGYPRIVDVPPIPDDLACTGDPDTVQFGGLCVPAHRLSTAEVIEARERLARQAEEIRAARPAPPSSDIDLPEDFGQAQGPALEGGS